MSASAAGIAGARGAAAGEGTAASGGSATPLRELVIASGNPKKAREVAEILSPLGIRLLKKDDFEVWPAVEETGSTYLENAVLKARAVAEMTGRPALGEDSGIEVDALGGAPGIRSARFAGDGAGDEANNARLVALLEGVPAEQRTARYRCVAVVLLPGGAVIAGEGTCEGRIGLEPRGGGGFGYDPWFVPEGESRTMAELSSEEKHRISHRGKALRALTGKLAPLAGQAPGQARPEGAGEEGAAGGVRARGLEPPWGEPTGS